jgi:hypothetical protein
VHRRFEGDYQLRVTEGSPPFLGAEAPLAQWYDQMKASLILTPTQDPAINLHPGEILWVKSKPAKLLKDVTALQATPGILFRNKKLGKGQLFLTSERLIWTGTETLPDFWLRKLIAAWTVRNRFFAIQYEGLEIFKFRFLEESILKWLTYLALVAQQIKQTHGHTISLSNY